MRGRRSERGRWSDCAQWTPRSGADIVTLGGSRRPGPGCWLESAGRASHTRARAAWHTEGMTEAALGQVTGELNSLSLVELAVARLKYEIMSGATDPGERLVEEQLTRRLGISR